MKIIFHMANNDTIELHGIPSVYSMLLNKCFKRRKGKGVMGFKSPEDLSVGERRHATLVNLDQVCWIKMEEDVARELDEINGN
jgi:hypothetical protein